MADKQRPMNFDTIISTLKAKGFEAAPSASAKDAILVSKGAAAAVLIPDKDRGAAFAVEPGALIKGQVARLLDRGYQKFLRTDQFEIPATAAQLQAIHVFSEELTLLTGGTSLYNEALGTTSDLYRYDRLKGREAADTRGARPWELSGGH